VNKTTEPSLLHVAFPSDATTQQPPDNSATGEATSAQQPPAKPASLLEIARNKLRNTHATSAENGMQQAQQITEMVVAPVRETHLERQRNARRQKVIAMLETAPDNQRAIYTDINSDPHNVILAVAVRNLATCEMLIPKVKYDPWRLLELIERHGATTH